MPINDDAEDTIEVQACPDLSDHRFVGGVRLIVPGGSVVDLTPRHAHRLVEDILLKLYVTGRMKGTI